MTDLVYQAIDDNHNNNNIPSFILQVWSRLANALWYIGTAYVVFASVAAAFSNSFISMTTSSIALINELDDELEKDDSDSPWPFITSMGIASAFIMVGLLSNVVQKLFKNPRKIHALLRINACCPKKIEVLEVSEQSSASISEDEESLSGSSVNSDSNQGELVLNYKIYPKAPPNLFFKIANLFTFAGELILGAGSAYSLIKNIGEWLFAESPMWWNIINYSAIPFIGIPSALSFMSVLNHEQNSYDQAQLLTDHINNKYAHWTNTQRFMLMAGLFLLRHFIVDLAIISGETGDATSFEVIFGDLTFLDDLLGSTTYEHVSTVLTTFFCLCIAISKLLGYHSKFNGALFALLGGQVYANQDNITNKSGKNKSGPNNRTCDNYFCNFLEKETYVGSILGMLYRNVVATAYQVSKKLSLLVSFGAGGFSGIISAANIASLFHDLPPVPVSLQEDEPVAHYIWLTMLLERLKSLSECISKATNVTSDAKDMKNNDHETQPLLPPDASMKNMATSVAQPVPTPSGPYGSLRMILLPSPPESDVVQVRDNRSITSAPNVVEVVQAARTPSPELKEVSNENLPVVGVNSGDATDSPLMTHQSSPATSPVGSLRL